MALLPLLAFVAVDCVTGVMCAAQDHALSGKVGWNGLSRRTKGGMMIATLYKLYDAQRLLHGGKKNHTTGHHGAFYGYAGRHGGQVVQLVEQVVRERGNRPPGVRTRFC
jgi:hypothetical protein